MSHTFSGLLQRRNIRTAIPGTIMWVMLKFYFINERLMGEKKIPLSPVIPLFRSEHILFHSNIVVIVLPLPVSATPRAALNKSVKSTFTNDLGPTKLLQASVLLQCTDDSHYCHANCFDPLCSQPSFILLLVYEPHFYNPRKLTVRLKVDRHVLHTKKNSKCSFKRKF